MANSSLGYISASIIQIIILQNVLVIFTLLASANYTLWGRVKLSYEKNCKQNFYYTFVLISIFVILLMLFDEAVI